MFLLRFYLKEKLSIIHIFAMVIILSGITFIAQPSFLITKTVVTHINTSVNYSESSITHSNHTTLVLSETVYQTLGLSLALISGFLYALFIVLTKQLQKYKIHFSVMNVYSCYFGFPLTIALSAISIATGITPKDMALINQPAFAWDVFYNVSSAILGKFISIFVNKFLNVQNVWISS